MVAATVALECDEWFMMIDIMTGKRLASHAINQVYIKKRF